MPSPMRKAGGDRRVMEHIEPADPFRRFRPSCTAWLYWCRSRCPEPLATISAGSRELALALQVPGLDSTAFASSSMPRRDASRCSSRGHIRASRGAVRGPRATACPPGDGDGKDRQPVDAPSTPRLAGFYRGHQPAAAGRFKGQSLPPCSRLSRLTTLLDTGDALHGE